MTETTRQIIDYYPKLLRLVDRLKPKDIKMITALVDNIVTPQVSVQEIRFSGYADTGSFKIGYKGNETNFIPRFTTTSSIMYTLQTVPGLENVTVTGSMDDVLTVTMTGVAPSAELMTVNWNTLNSPLGVDIVMSIIDVDLILPLAVQEAFNLLPGSKTAVGVQLDTVAKYIGVSRYGRGVQTFINLDDDDFIGLIRVAIARNSIGASLQAIDNFLSTFFPSQIFIYDYGSMSIGYFIAPGALSNYLIQTLVGQGLLPKPLGVRLTAIVYFNNTEILFGFNTYTAVNPNASPYNSYGAYSQSVTWLSYANVVTP